MKFLLFIELQYSVIRLFAILFLSIVAYGQILTPPVECGYDRREHIASGIEYRERCYERGDDGPLTYQILEVNPANPSVNLLLVRAGDRPSGKERVSSMAQRYGATAAINGGYFVVNGDNAGASLDAYQFNRKVLTAGASNTALLFCEELNFREKLAIGPVNLAPNKPAQVTATCDPVDVIAGGPQLVRNGKRNFGGDSSDRRNPRTAVALTNRGTILFVTVDGRQQKSAGMKLEELGAELVSLGVVDALNLDGGGSTTMVVKDAVRNSPSDGRERAVGNGILIFSVHTSDELATLVERLAADPAQISGNALTLLRQRIKTRDFDGVRKIADGSGISVQAARLLREAVYAIKAR